MKRVFLILFLLVGISLGNATRGEAAEEIGSVLKTETVLTGLNNPWGIALRSVRSSPGTFEIFIAESGAGRVLRLWTKQGQEPATLIDGYPTASLHADSPWEVGPIGLDWVTPSKLAVTTASEKQVRVYSVPPQSKAIEIADAEHVAEPSPATNRLSGTGITAVSASEYSAYFVLNSRSPSTGLLRSEIRGNRLKRVSPFLSESRNSPSALAAGIATTPSGRPDYLVVARQVIGDDEQSRLTFFDPIRGTMALDLEVPLRNLAALAYSPSGNLYAVDVQWDEPQRGAVYRLEDTRRDGKQSCRTVEVARVTRPIDLEFADRNTLYVTSLGEDVNASKGSLVMIKGTF